MKTLTLQERPGFKTTEIIRTVMERAAQGITVTDMRARCRVLDALDKLPTDAAAIDLEDADHGTLVKAVNIFPFGLASKDLLTILDGIIEAT